jgi:hypothetical protein
MNATPPKFTGFVLRAGRKFESICPELDVASFGRTVTEARAALVEACQLHVESAIESNLPYLRPMPADDHPLHGEPARIMDQLTLTIEVAVKAHTPAAQM